MQGALKVICAKAQSSTSEYNVPLTEEHFHLEIRVNLTKLGKRFFIDLGCIICDSQVNFAPRKMGTVYSQLDLTA